VERIPNLSLWDRKGCKKTGVLTWYPFPALFFLKKKSDEKVSFLICPVGTGRDTSFHPFSSKKAGKPQTCCRGRDTPYFKKSLTKKANLFETKNANKKKIFFCQTFFVKSNIFCQVKHFLSGKAFFVGVVEGIPLPSNTIFVRKTRPRLRDIVYFLFIRLYRRFFL